MQRELLGVPTSCRVHIWQASLPGNVHTCCPGPPSAPPTLTLWLSSQTESLSSPAVSGVRGRQWLVL
eukprot:1142438-Pelagomonas_calceolata.AAC.2